MYHLQNEARSYLLQCSLFKMFHIQICDNRTDRTAHSTAPTLLIKLFSEDKVGSAEAKIQKL